ncbi:MAG TPA: hypothetical protein VIX37_14985, partial [Candidatus Sulfotelmatobacter sp.]
MLQSLPVRQPDQLVGPRWSAHNRPHNIGTSSFGDCSGPGTPGPHSDGGSFFYPMFKDIRAEEGLVFEGCGLRGSRATRPKW